MVGATVPEKGRRPGVRTAVIGADILAPGSDWHFFPWNLERIGIPVKKNR
jgi:hypothetical protein